LRGTKYGDRNGAQQPDEHWRKAKAARRSVLLRHVERPGYIEFAYKIMLTREQKDTMLVRNGHLRSGRFILIKAEMRASSASSEIHWKS
jgi:hypothetical protein